MNRLKTLFADKAEKTSILNVYCTAGFPALNNTKEIILALDKAGADIIELGIPFSDPLADGPTIQQSSERAIANGMNLTTLFNQLADLRNSTDIPIVLMGYLNSILQYGLEDFWAKAKDVGVDGFIFPDLPPHEYESLWKQKIIELDLCFSFLVTPETPRERVQYLDSLSSGFIYAVSSSSTTGAGVKKDYTAIEAYLKRLRSYQLNNPILAGFGVKTNEDFSRINNIVDGAIIGSAFIQYLSKNGTREASIQQFVQGVKG